MSSYFRRFCGFALATLAAFFLASASSFLSSLFDMRYPFRIEFNQRLHSTRMVDGRLLPDAAVRATVFDRSCPCPFIAESR